MLSEKIREEYEEIRVLHRREGSLVQLVREKKTGTFRVYRSFRGDSSVYARLQQVHCPHLPRIEAVEEQNGQVEVLEEYIQGDTLAELLQGSRLTEQETLKIAEQLCRALEVLHSLGAVHRDIKPENVILCGARAVLIDFDASRIYKEEQTTDTRVMGTTGYAAPEQYGFGQTDGRSDIYAMGVLLNVMQTGRHPSESLAGGRLRPVIETCIYVNADHRYQTVKALEKALRRAAARPVRLWLCAIGGAAAMLALGFLLGRWTAPQPLAPSVPEPPVLEEPALPPAAPEPEPNPDPDPIPEQRPLPSSFQTEFTYDLDGDGTEEPYIFAIRINAEVDGRNVGPQQWDSLSFRSSHDSNLRFAVPVVWQAGEQGYEPVPAFGPLLQQVKSELYTIAMEGTDPLKAVPWQHWMEFGREPCASGSILKTQACGGSQPRQVWTASLWRPI